MHVDHHRQVGGRNALRAVRSAITRLIPELLRGAEGGDQLASKGREMLLYRIENCIDAHLADPRLTPRLIAQAHGTSLRSLFKLFEDSPTSLAELIREKRLLRCMDELRAPSRGRQTVTGIAFANGFSDAAHFSRLFRERFGMTPRDVRETGAA